MVTESTQRIPEHYDEAATVMSNFDHTIDDDVAKELKERECYGQYAGWNFCGYVWWDRENERWACEVWTYTSWNETLCADSLEAIMEEVSARYGYD